MAYDIEFRGDESRPTLALDADWYEQDETATFVHFMKKNSRNLDGRPTHSRLASVPVEVIRIIRKTEVSKDSSERKDG